MPAHAVAHGVGAALHLSDLLQGDPQLSQQLNPPQNLRLLLTVIPVAVAAPLRLQQPLRLVKADVFLRNAYQASTSLIFMGLTSFYTVIVYLPERGKSREFSKKFPRVWMRPEKRGIMCV